jgi:hypothetical protein
MMCSADQSSWAAARSDLEKTRVITLLCGQGRTNKLLLRGFPTRNYYVNARQGGKGAEIPACSPLHPRPSAAAICDAVLSGSSWL